MRATTSNIGVIDPMSPKLEVGQKGVGTRVTMSDEQIKPLVDLIVGKPVRDAEGQRYVREAGRDVVYVIEIDPSKLTTDFENWIEKDLLKLNAWDLQQVEVKDYSAEMRVVMNPQGRPSIGVAWDPRADMTLAYSDSDAKWTPVKLQSFDPKSGQEGGYVEFKMTEEEELNGETLNALKNALDDLKIVDVKRKPQGLSANLKAGEDFMNNREAFQDLITKGFAATATPDGGSQEIISSDGEVIATMKNGTEYVLRFGMLTDVAGSQDKDQSAEDKAATPADAEKKADKSDVHRYLFVMARLNKDAVKQPDLVKLPELPAKSEAQPADQTLRKQRRPRPKKLKRLLQKRTLKHSRRKEGGRGCCGEIRRGCARINQPSRLTRQSRPRAPTKEDAEKKDDAAAQNLAPKQDKEIEKVIAERKAIEKENQRKLDEYQALLKKGEESVKDLNLRFGDWYFVVDDDVFQKVRVSRDKVIKKKDQPKAEGAAAPAAPGTGIPGLPVIPGASK